MTELIKLPEQRVLHVRDSVPSHELPAFQGRALQATWSALDAAHVIDPGHPYVRYHLVTDDEVDVEVGVPVTPDAVAIGTARVGSLPGGAALTHRHIDSWDLVDRAAPRVIGAYLLGRSREPLFDLARSGNIWERRTAITAAFWIIRAGDVDDPLTLVDMLLDDPEHFIQTSVGTAIRELNRITPERIETYLQQNAHRVSPATRRLMADPRRTTPHRATSES